MNTIHAVTVEPVARRGKGLCRNAVAVPLSGALLFGVGCGSDDGGSATDTSTETTASDGSAAEDDGGAAEDRDSKTSEPKADKTVTESGPIELKVGERVAIELKANPTTGYQWEPTEKPDEAVVRIVSDTYTAEATDRVGAGGTQVIVVEGLKAGTTSLKLGYARPWEDSEPTETATFDITVS